MNKEDVVVKMKTVSNRPKKYFQPVLTNNTRVISAKISESVDKERVVQVKVNLNKTDSNVFDKKIDLSDKKDKIEIAEEKLELSEEKEELKDNLDKKEETKDTLEIKEEVTKDKDEVSDNVIDSIREQLEKETDKIENKEKIDKDITTKMDLPIKIKEEIRSEQLQSEAENIKEFKTKLFLLASIFIAYTLEVALIRFSSAVSFGSFGSGLRLGIAPNTSSKPKKTGEFSSKALSLV